LPDLTLGLLLFSFQQQFSSALSPATTLNSSFSHLALRILLSETLENHLRGGGTLPEDKDGNSALSSFSTRRTSPPFSPQISRAPFESAKNPVAGISLERFRSKPLYSSWRAQIAQARKVQFRVS